METRAPVRRALLAVFAAALLAGGAVAAAVAVGAGEHPYVLVAIATFVFVAFGLVLVLHDVIRPLQRVFARTTAEQSVRLEELEEELQRTQSELRFAEQFAAFQRELDGCDTEEGLFLVIRKTLQDLGPRTELLIESRSREILTPVASNVARGERLCPVASGSHCPAIRLNSIQEYPTSTSIHACSLLRNRRGGACGGVCVPVRILGQTEGVLHIATPEYELPPESLLRAVDGAVSAAGNRLGVIRATSAMAEQATTDPLTGLVNRRTLEREVRELQSKRVPYTLLVADLDHFKQLNDQYGHETGDTALTHFAKIVERTVRGGDIPCRFGGEEFVVLFPDCLVEAAAPVVHRIREALAETLERAGLPGFTASYGLADSSFGADFEHVFRFADHALFQAKDQGRDRLIIADPLDPPRPVTSFLPAEDSERTDDIR